MGVADVIPGVSGGTIAFITGIYDELIGSIRSINLELFRKLLKGEFSEFWKSLNGNFLMSVLANRHQSFFISQSHVVAFGELSCASMVLFFRIDLDFCSTDFP